MVARSGHLPITIWVSLAADGHGLLRATPPDNASSVFALTPRNRQRGWMRHLRDRTQTLLQHIPGCIPCKLLPAHVTRLLVKSEYLDKYGSMGSLLLCSSKSTSVLTGTERHHRFSNPEPKVSAQLELQCTRPQRVVRQEAPQVAVCMKAKPARIQIVIV